MGKWYAEIMQVRSRPPHSAAILNFVTALDQLNIHKWYCRTITWYIIHDVEQSGDDGASRRRSKPDEQNNA